MLCFKRKVVNRSCASTLVGGRRSTFDLEFDPYFVWLDHMEIHWARGFHAWHGLNVIDIATDPLNSESGCVGRDRDWRTQWDSISQGD